jgi:hypothetical protein
MLLAFKLRLITGKNDKLFIVASLSKPAYEICVLFSAKQFGARRSTVLSFSPQLVFLAYKCKVNLRQHRCLGSLGTMIINVKNGTACSLIFIFVEVTS